MKQQPNEVWKDIQGYEGLYQVSSLGRVKSLPRGNKKERIRVPRAAYHVEKELGYFCTLISRCCRGKKKTYKGYKWRFEYE